MADFNFDRLICSRELSMLKCLLPFFPPDIQKMLALYIKFSEFTRLLSLLHANDMHTLSAEHDKNQPGFPFPQQKPEMENLISALSGIMKEEDKKQMDSLLQAISVMKMFGELNEQGGGMDALSGMLTPEQKELFESYMNMMN